MADQRRFITDDLKKEVLNKIKVGELSYQDAEQQYGLSRYYHIKRWAKKFKVDLTGCGHTKILTTGHVPKLNTTPSIPMNDKTADVRDRRIMELVYALGVASEKINKLEALVHGKRFADNRVYSPE